MEKTLPSTRILVAIGAVVVGLLVVAAVLNATRSTPELDPATPEGVAQAFLLEVFDEDYDAAAEYFTPELADRCEAGDRFFYGEEPGRAALVDTEIDGDRARVEVEITTTYGESPFDLSESTFEATLIMRRIDGRWLISEPVWQFFSCPEGVTP
jgi:hypothetical protein